MYYILLKNLLILTIVYYDRQKTEAVVCYPYNNSDNQGIVMSSDFYTCPDDTYCCRNGCCEKIYYAWYLWVFVILGILGCCFTGYFIKRRKLFNKRLISPSEDLNERRIRALDMISRAHIFTTQNSRMDPTANTVGIGGTTTLQHITHINVSGRTPPAYTQEENTNVHQRTQQEHFNNTSSANASTRTQTQSDNDLPPSYSSIWVNR